VLDITLNVENCCTSHIISIAELEEFPLHGLVRVSCMYVCMYVCVKYCFS